MIMEKKPTKRQLKSHSNCDLIFNTAKALFREYGYEKTTMSDICSQSGLSVGTIYHYYHSKEEMLFKICEQIGQVVGTLEEDITEKAANPRKYIFEYLLLYAATWEELGSDMALQVYRVFDRVFLNDDCSFKQVKSRVVFSRFIAEAQKSGTFDTSMASEKAVDYLLMVCRGFLHEWCLRKGSYCLVDASSELLPRILETFIISGRS